MKKLFSILFLLPFFTFAQETPKSVQITGVIVSTDSLTPIPFANVLIKGNYRGTMSDYSGFYSIVASTGDTVIFSSMGYQRIEYVIPDSLENKQYSLIQMMDRDTVLVPAAVINVWPSYSQFKQAFIEQDVTDQELARAEQNLDKDILREQAVAMGLGAAGNHMLSEENARAKLYYSGQLPPNNLLNPLVWAKLIKAWQNGDFKKKRKN